MCGIFGIVAKNENQYGKKDIQNFLETLFRLSESRGKEAAGLAVKRAGSVDVLKLPVAATDFLRSPEYKDFFDKAFGLDKQGFSAIIGHARLATHGTEYLNHNNQPVIKEKAVCVHNGIIVNDKQLWEKFPNLKREFEVDTEIILSLLQLFFSETGSLVSAARKTFETIEGSASLAALFNDNYQLLLATNTGSLYTCPNLGRDLFVFASERYILEQFIGKAKRISVFLPEAIRQVLPGTTTVLDVRNLELERPVVPHEEIKIIDCPAGREIIATQNHFVVENSKLRPELKKEMNETWDNIYSGSGLRRCVKCLLPETMTFIDFDEQGVCNYCRGYEKIRVKGPEALDEVVSRYRRADGKPDCIVAFSGGRDSSYGLHYVKKVLGMNPIAFTYDWGMLTDLGRRNQARVCGKLGVENIVISADIRQKRKNILMNLKAWLRRPEMGTIPLLMAGDKKYLYYGEWLRKKTGTNLLIYSNCSGFENDFFKVGLAGVRMTTDISFVNLPLRDKIKMSAYYARQYLLNPFYINRSLLDTISALYYTIGLPENKLYLYHYLKWNEKEILSTIINEYGWEKEDDTPVTWRLDDGTAAFYNYIYLTVMGFTEFDVMRSIQIKEGHITRGEAYRLIQEENKPRYESMEWYARTIGFDVNKAIKRINEIPKFYLPKK